jgi:hypothetical protein
LRTSPEHNNQEGEIIIRTLSGGQQMDETANVNAHLTVTDRVKIGESKDNMGSYKGGHGEGSGLGAIQEDEMYFDGNRIHGVV